jgi:hypothetical protein
MSRDASTFVLSELSKLANAGQTGGSKGLLGAPTGSWWRATPMKSAAEDSGPAAGMRVPSMLVLGELRTVDAVASDHLALEGEDAH